MKEIVKIWLVEANRENLIWTNAESDHLEGNLVQMQALYCLCYIK